MNVLLIEDDPQTAATIAQILERDEMTVEWVETGEAGAARAGHPEIAVVILDWMLPGMSGVDVVAQLRRAGVEKPVLMLSALGRADHRVEGLDSGADDYLAKPYEPTELVARLRALMRRTSAQARHPVLIHADIELHIRARTAHRAGQHLKLSPKEFDLLRYLVENAGETVTREMLLRHVWNLNFDPQTNVIDVNLVRLRRKLEIGFAEPCLFTVRGQGYRLGPENPRSSL